MTGMVIEDVAVKQNKINGVSRNYKVVNGEAILLFESNYTDCVLEGERAKYSKNGEIKVIEFYKLVELVEINCILILRNNYLVVAHFLFF